MRGIEGRQGIGRKQEDMRGRGLGETEEDKRGRWTLETVGHRRHKDMGDMRI